jgi:Tfp pilus assembly protein PilN
LKTLHLNLAASPYRDYRPLYAVVVVASVVIAFLMLNNIDTYYRYVRETRTTREEIANIESQIAVEKRRADAAAAQTKGVDIVTLGRETKFINAQLAERAFSWSELLDRLEDVMPNDVRITSISPSFTTNGLVHLNLQCEAKSTNGMLATITRFQGNQNFSSPFPNNEADTGMGFRFGLEVDYRPSIPRAVTR